jgi:hypothetical protein
VGLRAHELWHVVVLVSALLGAGGAVLLALSSVVFDTPPPGLSKARPLVIALIACAAAIVLAEWLIVH